ncbi:MAG TPA: hypothetical protein VIR58_17655 [Acidimicrobiales bacterium]
MTTIEIDYSRYGYAKRINVPLFKRERSIEPGDRVKVIGDDGPERIAIVAALVDAGRKAILEFDELPAA